MFQNLHTHTSFSDGSDAPALYLDHARRLGMPSVGFSDHSPLPFENSFALRENKVEAYCRTVNLLKSGDIPVFLGMEVDFIPGMGHSFASFRENYPLDYLIGSVHLVRNGLNETLWFIDGPDPATYDEGIRSLFGGDARRAVTAYFRQINEMLETSRMEIIGHFDKIKMHNRGRFFSENDGWYRDLVEETLRLAKEKEVIVEVNTRGLYKKRCDTLFPSPWILRRINELNIPVLITSDAHRPEELAMLFGETANLLREVGFRGMMQLTGKGWEEEGIHFSPTTVLTGL